jgi:hypothetical protein
MMIGLFFLKEVPTLEMERIINGEDLNSFVEDEMVLIHRDGRNITKV